MPGLPSPEHVCARQRLLLLSPVPEQLQQSVICGGLLLLTVDLFQLPQQKVPQASGFFDLTVHRLEDALALGIDC